MRFLGRQANLYVYVGNDPVNRKDPYGLYGTAECEYYNLMCVVTGTPASTEDFITGAPRTQRIHGDDRAPMPEVGCDFASLRARDGWGLG